MSFVRSVWADLVDKRLWPVAVALVVAAVGVPVLLHKPTKPVDISSAPPAAAAAADRVAPGSTVSLEQGPAAGLLIGGHLHDPFHQLHVPKAVSSTAGSTATTQSTSSGTSPAPSGNTTVGPPSGGGSSGGGQSHRSSGTKLRVSFGKAGESLQTYDLAPLTALASAGSEPALVFLGMEKDGKTAAFLVSSDVKPQGDGRCSPSSSVCATLLMKAGDTEFLDVTTGAASVQYELDVKRIVKG